MKEQRSARRPFGSGSLIARHGSWYGQWRVGGRLVKRKLGPLRTKDNRDGLTRTQADRVMAKLIQEVRTVPATSDPKTFAEIGGPYLVMLKQVRDLKPTTLSDYRSILRQWDDHFGSREVSRLGPDDVMAYVRAKSASGLSRKTIRNHIAFAGGCLGFAVKQGWLQSNPVDRIEKPRVRCRNTEVRHLNPEELRRLMAAVPDDHLGPTDRALYLTATKSGLRQGELLALRWMDVDFAAGVVRVRQSVTRGRLGTPKSRRSSRSVPLADSLARELTAHLSDTHYSADEDYVFCHPETGRFYDASRQRKRFKQAVKAAGLRPIRFHDLRHTFGTQLASVGVPIRTIQQWMGHESIETTQVYADYAPNPVREREWAEQAFERLGGRDAA